MYSMTFKDLHIANIAKIVPNDLTYFFKERNWTLDISETVTAGTTCEMTLCTSHFSNILVF